MKTFIDDIFKNQSITEWGVCDFSAVVPLIECRAKARIPENAKSVIVCLLPYYVGEGENRNISRYAVVPDYHKVAGDILKSVCENLQEKFGGTFEPFADSSPINEVNAAVLSGVGFLGKNSLIINKKYGSYVFIGEIITDLYIEPDTPLNLSCLGCDLCEKNCVGGALKNQKFDLTKCVSFISQKKGELSESEKALIKKSGLAWGCDGCVDVCPHNQNPLFSPIKAFYDNIVWEINGGESDEFICSRAFNWRGKKVIERNLLILKEKQSGISEREKPRRV